MGDKLGPVLFIGGGILLVFLVTTGKLTGTGSPAAPAAGTAGTPGVAGVGAKPAGSTAAATGTGTSGGAYATPIGAAVAAAQVGPTSSPGFGAWASLFGLGGPGAGVAASGGTTATGVPALSTAPSTLAYADLMQKVALPGNAQAHAAAAAVPAVSTPWQDAVQAWVAQATAGTPANTFTIPDAFSGVDTSGISAIPIVSVATPAIDPVTTYPTIDYGSA